MPRQAAARAVCVNAWATEQRLKMNATAAVAATEAPSVSLSVLARAQQLIALFVWAGAALHRAVLLAPLRELYLAGPQYKGFGFWEGAPPSDICAQLTQVPAAHWEANAGACAQLIDNKLYGFALFAQLLLAMLLLYRLASFFWHDWVVRPRERDDNLTLAREQARVLACALALPNEYQQRGRKLELHDLGRTVE